MTDSKYKWWALALLWVAFFLQQGTRQLFGPSVPSICASFGVDKVALGVVGTVFAKTLGGNMSWSMSSLAGFYLVGALVILLARTCFLECDCEKLG